jgi:hypothetical protein
MRRKTILFLASVAVIFMMAGNGMPFFVHNGKQLADTTVTAIDSLLESADTAGMMSAEDKALLDSMAMADRTETDTDTTASLLPDTTKMDSLELAVYRHNKAVDDSIRADSIFRSKQGGIDAPVTYEASDSLVYDAVTKTAHLYGDAKVNYTTMELESEKVYMSLDSSIVHARVWPTLRENSRERLFSRWVTTPTRTIRWPSISKQRKVLSAMSIPSRKTDSCAASGQNATVRVPST